MQTIANGPQISVFLWKSILSATLRWRIRRCIDRNLIESIMRCTNKQIKGGISIDKVEMSRINLSGTQWRILEEFRGDCFARRRTMGIGLLRAASRRKTRSARFSCIIDELRKRASKRRLEFCRAFIYTRIPRTPRNYHFLRDTREAV